MANNNGWPDTDHRFNVVDGRHSTSHRKGDDVTSVEAIAGLTSVGEQHATGKMRSEVGGPSKYATGMANANGRYDVAAQLPKADGSA